MRRQWPVAVLLGLAIAILVTHLVVEHQTREPPNYSEIEPGLWVGGYVAEPPRGVTAVLNLCEAEDSYAAESHRWQPIRDGEPAPTLAWLREQVEYIEQQRAEGRSVYVHCRNGVSRSGMVAVAYLMRREGWSRDVAITRLRESRPGLRPNSAFMKLLLDWERSIGTAPDKAQQ